MPRRRTAADAAIEYLRMFLGDAPMDTQVLNDLEKEFQRLDNIPVDAETCGHCGQGYAENVPPGRMRWI